MMLIIKRLGINLLRKSILVHLDKSFSLRILRRHLFTYKAKSLLDLKKSSLMRNIKHLLTRLFFGKYKHYETLKLCQSFIFWKDIKKRLNKTILLVKELAIICLRKAFFNIIMYKLVNMNYIKVNMINKDKRFKIIKQYLQNRLLKITRNNKVLFDSFMLFRNKSSMAFDKIKIVCLKGNSILRHCFKSFFNKIVTEFCSD